jgi:hypothetical protein
MSVSVKVGLLCMEVIQLEGVLWIVMSRKFSLLLGSVSWVNFILEWVRVKETR